MAHLTKWINPTSDRVKLRIFQGPGNFAKVDIEPGEAVNLPGNWDRAIHEVRDGMVVGGLAPQLKREGQTEVVHDALTHDDSKIVASQAAEIERLRREITALTKVAAESAAVAEDAKERANAAEAQLNSMAKDKAELEALIDDEPKQASRPQRSAPRR